MKATSLPILLLGVTLLYTAPPSLAQEEGKGKASELTSESQAALKQLYATNAAAKALGAKAHSILVFPSVKKAGLVVGGQYGEGTLLLAREAGLNLPVSADLKAALRESAYLQRSIGRAGLLALKPLQVVSDRDRWHRFVLTTAGN